MKNQLKKQSISKFEGMKKEKMVKIFGGATAPLPINQVVQQKLDGVLNLIR